MKANGQNIPEELKARPQWVAWWSVPGDGRSVKLPSGAMTRKLEPRPKPHKLPLNARSGGMAMANNPGTWSTYAQAAAAAERWNVTGVGYVFSAQDPYTGIDLDDCRDPATGALAAWAREIVSALASNTEVSPSGCGVKILARGKPGAAGSGRRTKLESGEIEMYSRDRYFTITGERLAEAPAEIAGRQEELDALYARFFGAVESAGPGRAARPRDGRFARLWSGDTALYGGDDSRADLALCGELARRTGGDLAEMDKLFRQSGLYREKWERADYRERTLQLAVASLRPPAPGGSLKLTEMGNAERLVARHGDDIRFCAEIGRWLAWDGARWTLDAGLIVLQLAKETARSIYREAESAVSEEAHKNVLSWAHRSESAARVEATLRLAKSDPRVAVSMTRLDADPWLLNCLNGTLDLRTGQLRPHRREDLLTRLCPVEYDPAARAPRWEHFLEEVFAPYPDLPAFLKRAVGYSLTGVTTEECLFLLHGTGRNGKGAFLKTLTSVLGDYAGTADFSTFVESRDSDRPRDDIANMRGRHFISAQESREGARLAESLIKWLTGGDLVRARRLFENSYEFLPTFKIWLATNHKPKVGGTDPAIWNRIKLAPFSVCFEGREDRNLKAELRAEAAGVLAWAVAGCLAWQKEGLGVPETVREATGGYRNENDLVARFLDERCVVGDFARSRARVLYGEFKKWAEECGERALRERDFSGALVARGFERLRKNDGMWYLRVGVAVEGEA